jgi:hypothetical protein
MGSGRVGKLRSGGHAAGSHGLRREDVGCGEGVAVRELGRQNFWGIASLFDAYHVPKLSSQQLLPFGRSGDGLEVLTIGVGLFLVLSV